MADQVLRRGAVGHKGGIGVEPHHAAHVPDGAEHVVRQIPPGRIDGAAVGVGSHQGSLRHPRQVPEGPVAQVGHVQIDAKALRLPDKHPAQIGEALVGAHRAGQIVAVVPGQIDGPHAPAVHLLQTGRVTADQLRPLDGEMAALHPLAVAGSGLKIEVQLR